MVMAQCATVSRRKYRSHLKKNIAGEMAEIMGSWFFGKGARTTSRGQLTANKPTAAHWLVRLRLVGLWSVGPYWLITL